jgi:hypothetical protein
MHKKKNRFTLFIISSISMGKNIMLMRVLQAFVTIVVTMSRVMFLLLEELVVIMSSMVLTAMWLSLIALVILKLFTTAVALGLTYMLTIGWARGRLLVITRK